MKKEDVENCREERRGREARKKREEGKKLRRKGMNRE